MPTYQYRCSDCGYEFEQFQSITARALRKCPNCGQLSLKRLIGTGAGIIFKGPGFYQTDYRSESYKKAQKKEKEAVSTATGEKKTTDGSTGSPSQAKSKESKADRDQNRKLVD